MENIPSLTVLDDVNQIVAGLTFNLSTEHLKHYFCGFIFQDKKAD